MIDQIAVAFGSGKDFSRLFNFNFVVGMLLFEIGQVLVAQLLRPAIN